MSNTFVTLAIQPELVALLQQHGITSPTPVQQQAIPQALDGKDIIVQAQTGTGKTLAFALPILQRIQPQSPHVQALIVTPTRELAIQITQEFQKLAPAVGCSVLAAYGGQDVEAQIRKLQGAAQIVVGTPGRLLDHLRRETITLWKLQTLVLDEADQMLHMGFLTEVQEIIEQTSKHRQTMLFSATMPDSVRQLAARYMSNPEDTRIRGTHVTLDTIEQVVVETTDRAKLQTLVTLIEQDNPYLAVAFCRTKIRAKKLTESLQEQGLPADELHGDLTQAKREQVMKRFRNAKLQILVATDIAARGLDVEGVTHVYNYDIPHDAEAYIHRIGRTGRAGQTGKAVTLATPRDRMTLQGIERGIHQTLTRMRIDGSLATTAASADVDPERRRSSRTESAGRGGRTSGGGERGRRASSGGERRPGGRGAQTQQKGRQQGQRQERGKQGSTSESRAGAGGESRGWGTGLDPRPQRASSGRGGSASTGRSGAGRSDSRGG
ncbi:hypothetical protein PA598K_02514, partial [Paenibacillus sp. 598K]|uniref:DEAD/DEAH box helicase n=1 Tax=Paenibacillus sp. 598K TaxID=1117987 RepID=UPI000FFADD21